MREFLQCAAKRRFLPNSQIGGGHILAFSESEDIGELSVSDLNRILPRASGSSCRPGSWLHLESAETERSSRISREVKDVATLQQKYDDDGINSSVENKHPGSTRKEKKQV